MNVTKIILTSARLKYTKFSFGWGPTPDPAEGTYNTPVGFHS